MKLFELIDILKSSPYNPNADVYIYDINEGKRMQIYDTDIDIILYDEVIDINIDVNRKECLYEYRNRN